MLLFTRDGAPLECICDHAKKDDPSKFHQKLKDNACQLKQVKPYTHWSNATKREIKEIKKGTSYELLWSIAPKHLWDDCLELEAYIRSNTAHDIYKFDGEVFKTVMSGEALDISQFC